MLALLNRAPCLKAGEGSTLNDMHGQCDNSGALLAFVSNSCLFAVLVALGSLQKPRYDTIDGVNLLDDLHGTPDDTCAVISRLRGNSGASAVVAT